MLVALRLTCGALKDFVVFWGQLQNTIRIDLHTAGAGLTFPKIENINVNSFGNTCLPELTLMLFYAARGFTKQFVQLRWGSCPAQTKNQRNLVYSNP